MNFEQIKNILKKSGESKIFDPMGSYTGAPEDKYEKPIQDADDL